MNTACWIKQLTGIAGIIMFLALSSCKIGSSGSHWSGEETFTICQYLELHQEEYSKFRRLLAEGKMQTTLCGYNPYGEGYTLFLPTNEAIDQFIGQHDEYNSFEEMLLDTGFIYTFVRYHTLKRKLHTDELPFGATTDSTLTGDRLSVGFFSNGDDQLIKINNTASVLKSNLDMTNGYIHVISKVLHKPDITGYNWLQQQDDFSILAGALELSGVIKRMWWTRYTILAEHDSVFNRNGIYSVDDLVSRIATPGMSVTNRENAFYKFTGYHIVGGEYFLNDLKWGNNNYITLDSRKLVIDVGMDIRINPGIDTYGVKVSGNGDTTLINYISPVWENCNIMTRTGPVHSISEVLFFAPLP
jgi:uncharacterized surface protein with fasciclin (FAS1) repeats